MPEEVKLSSGLMNLKFMQRAAGKSEKQISQPRTFSAGPAISAIEANRREMESRMQLPSAVCIQEEHSITKLYDLAPGRLSFRGMNRDLEAILNGTAGDDTEMKNDGNNTKDVSDREMAERYTTVNGTIAKKFGGKKRKSGDANLDDDDDLDPESIHANLSSGSNRKRGSGRPQRGRYFTAYSGSDRGRQRKHFAKNGGERAFQFGQRR